MRGGETVSTGRMHMDACGEHQRLSTPLLNSL